jgi:hypothetical protein
MKNAKEKKPKNISRHSWQKSMRLAAKRGRPSSKRKFEVAP